MGVNPYDYTPRELANIRIAHVEREDMKQRQVWEVARWQSYIVASCFAKIPTPQHLARFPWEGKLKDEIKNAHEKARMENPNYDKIFPDNI